MFVAAALLGVGVTVVMLQLTSSGEVDSAIGERGSDGAPCANASVSLTRANADVVRAATLCLLNQERAAHGIRALVVRRDLESGAGAYSRLMVSSGFFAHKSPGGSTLSSRVKRTDYLDGAESWSLAENLGWGTGRSRTPVGMVAAWMASPGHRDNLLSADYSDIGVGVAIGSPTPGCDLQAVTYTTDFGRRRG